MNKVCNILKFIFKLLLGIIFTIAILAIIYYGIDYAFRDILPNISRAVLSNFIVFAGVIVLVMKLVVKPSVVIEQAQTAIVEEIEKSETTKIESEEVLSAVEKSVANISAEIDDILKKSDENARLVGAKILEDAEKTALVIKENTTKSIENSQLLLKNDLIRRASLASVEVAKSHIINELNNNSELHNKLIDESITALEGVEIEWQAQ